MCSIQQWNDDKVESGIKTFQMANWQTLERILPPPSVSIIYRALEKRENLVANFISHSDVELKG